MKATLPNRASFEKDLRLFLKTEAEALGFCSFGIASAAADPDLAKRLRSFIDADYHGSMDWIEETYQRRISPDAMWSQAKSAIVVAMNYGPDTDPLLALKQTSSAAISVYAKNRDYHDIIKGKLKTLAGKVAARAACEIKVFVDTAPLMEKPLAAKAGLGWQGKHTNLVSREHGSWLFLGVILTDLELTLDEPEADHCGSCQACLDICPTNAFPAPYQLDARRCISYLTIEHKGPIAPEFRKAIGNRIYGCDDCLAVCPWNKFASIAAEAKLQARGDLRNPALADLLQLDDLGFRALFSGSPIKRIGRDRFIRNVLIAAGNSENATLIPLIIALLSDASPLVRGAAVWALSCLMDQSEPEDAAKRFDGVLQRAQTNERDETVLEEWAAAFGAFPHQGAIQ
jgi:epoxyqueuosine reductase